MLRNKQTNIGQNITPPPTCGGARDRQAETARRPSECTQSVDDWQAGALCSRAAFRSPWLPRRRRGTLPRSPSRRPM